MKTILIIAGSDSGGGAGVQADIKTAYAHNVFATTAITALTAQNTIGVQNIYDISPEFIGEQIDAVLDDIGADVIKTGMLNNAEVIAKTASKLKTRNLKLVLDPVMVSSSGHKLLDDNAVETLKTKLIPLATIITPNIPEAEVLTGLKIQSVDDMCKAGKALLSLHPSSFILLKGGHLQGEEAVDILFHDGKATETRNPKLKTSNTHGTGCTLASAIACNLANGQGVEAAVAKAQEYVRKAIMNAPDIGTGENKPLRF